MREEAEALLSLPKRLGARGETVLVLPQIDSTNTELRRRAGRCLLPWSKAAAEAGMAMVFYPGAGGCISLIICPFPARRRTARRSPARRGFVSCMPLRAHAGRMQVSNG